MIHAKIDSVSARNIVGFECGTRAVFDERHGDDPLWIFVDHNLIRHRINIAAFLDDPTKFQVDKSNTIQPKIIKNNTSPPMTNRLSS